MSDSRPWIRRSLSAVLAAAALAAALVAPSVLNPFRLDMLASVLIFSVVIGSLRLLVGLVGLPSLGHASFVAVGGYAAALAAVHLTDQAVVGLGLALVAGGVVAVVVGAVAVRAQALYFLIVTLVVGELTFTLAQQWESVTRGTNGISGIRPFALAGVSLGSPRAIYFYVLAVVVCLWIALLVLERSPFALTLRGIRDNAARTRAIGYDVTRYRWAIFAVASTLAAVAGALQVQLERFASPSLASFELSALVLIGVIVGGVGRPWGPLVGALFVVGLRHELTSRLEHWQVILGALLVAIVFLRHARLGSRLPRRKRLGTDLTAA